MHNRSIAQWILVGLCLSGCASTTSLVFRNEYPYPVRLHVIFWDGSENTLLLKPCDSRVASEFRGGMEQPITTILVQGHNDALETDFDSGKIESLLKTGKEHPGTVWAIGKAGVHAGQEGDSCQLPPKEK